MLPCSVDAHQFHAFEEFDLQHRFHQKPPKTRSAPTRARHESCKRKKSAVSPYVTFNSVVPDLQHELEIAIHGHACLAHSESAADRADEVPPGKTFAVPAPVSPRGRLTPIMPRSMNKPPTPTPPESSPAASENTGSTPTPSPRAFCQATGFIYQGVGVVLMLGSCCFWSFSGRVQEEARPTEAGRAIVEAAKDFAPQQFWAMGAVVLLFAGGLAIAALGLGLQHERPASASWAKWTTLAVAIYFWAYLWMSTLVWERATARIALAAVMALAWTVLFLLAGASVAEMRKNPPEPKSSQSQWTARDEDDLRRASSPHSPDKTNR
ncbi:hypothetical protein B7486_16660 [cyanobacterium TDX16]|nr:hypothetical protein B7486_16660 [cyanobacterium TDX16]